MNKAELVLLLVLPSVLLAHEPQLQKTLVGHDKKVFCLAFSPDGKTLASGSLHEAKLWNVTTGENIASLDDTGLVRFVTFSPDGRMLALSTAQGEEGTIKLWNVAASRNIATLQTFNSGSFTAFSSDGKTLIWTDDKTTDSNGKARAYAQQTTIRRWNITTGDNTSICSICKKDSADESMARSGPKGENKVAVRLVAALAFSPDGKMLAARDNTGVVEIWDLPACKKTIAFCENSSYSEFSVAFSPNGKALALARGRESLLSKSREETMIDVRDVATGKSIATLSGHGAEVVCVAFSPDGKTLASCGCEPTVKLWNLATGENVANIDAGSEAVGQVVFSPSGNILASAAGHDGTIKLWSVATSDQVAQ